MADYAVVYRVGDVRQYVHYPHFQPDCSTPFYRETEHPHLEFQYLQGI